MKPKLSIIIPTHYTEYNKQAMLKEVLVAIFHCYNYSNAIETIVVENPEKTEHVTQIIAEACHGQDYNVVHTTSELGANRARNHGIQIAKSDIIALLDDDCVVEQGWIEGVLSAHILYPNAGVIGGSMKLVFNCEKPRWIEGYFMQCLAEVDHGEGVHDLSGHPDPYAAIIVSGNMTFKRAMYDKTSGFNNNIGYIGNNCMAQDEIQFIQECNKYGKPGRLYVGSMIVYHNIPTARCCIEYFMKKSYGDGYNFGQMVQARQPDICIEDAIVEQLLPKWSQHFHHNELSAIRQLIAHEESTRIYVYNLMKCKTAFFHGFEDYCTQNDMPSYEHNYDKSFLMNINQSNSRRTW